MSRTARPWMVGGRISQGWIVGKVGEKVTDTVALVNLQDDAELIVKAVNTYDGPTRRRADELAEAVRRYLDKRPGRAYLRDALARYLAGADPGATLQEHP